MLKVVSSQHFNPAAWSRI